MDRAGPSCACSTASARRHRAKQDEPKDPEIVEDSAAKIGENVGGANDEELSEHFSGGPVDPSVLKSFKTHVIASIWMHKVVFPEPLSYIV